MNKLSSAAAMNQHALMGQFDAINTIASNRPFESAALAIGVGSTGRIRLPNQTILACNGVVKASAPSTALAYQSLSAAGLAIGTSDPAKVKIVNTVQYLHNMVFCSKTTAEVAFTATTHDIAADAVNVKEACYLLSLIANGTATLTMGTIATGAGAAVVPATPASQTAIGYVRVAVDAGATPFDASTDQLSAGHLTVTYVDYAFTASSMPGEVAFTPTTHDIPANALTVQEACYLVTVDGNGAAALTMGPIATGAGNAKLPNRPATGTPVGYVRIAVAAGATPFDAGTNALNAGHLTTTYVNLGIASPRFDSE